MAKAACRPLFPIRALSIHNPGTGEDNPMKIHHLLLLVWVLIVTMWLFNQLRNKK